MTSRKKEHKLPKRPTVVVIMGVAGSGKTTVGTLLADMLGWQFADADSFHPAANVRKMADGAALDDQDRLPWLEALKGAIQNWLTDGKRAVLACSALKHVYRDSLRVDNQRVAFVYLKGDAELFEKRLKERRGHYMKVSMLESQLKTLEEPSAALYVDASNKPDRIASEIISSLDLQ